MRCILFLFHRPNEAKLIARRTQNRLKTHLPALVTGLIEFHKAQCFFMLAIQAAAVVVIRDGTLPASSYAQAQVNFALLHGIAINGFLPVSFTLLCLWNFGRKSWYIYLLTICTFVLSVVTFAMARTAYNDPNGVTSSGTYQDCGTINPSTVCTLGYTGYPEPWTSSNRLPFCATIGFLLLFDKLEVTRWSAFQRILKRLGHAKNDLVANLYEHVREFNKNFDPTGAKPLNIDILRARFTFIVSLVTNMVYLKYLVDQLIDLSLFNSIGVIDTTNWGFGQIVAVTIWFPPVFEYFYLEFRKSISYLNTQLPEERDIFARQILICLCRRHGNRLQVPSCQGFLRRQTGACSATGRVRNRSSP